MNKAILKKGKEKALCNQHHWIFSGALSQWPAQADGSLAEVYAFSGERLGTAYFNRKAQIAGRMIAFDEKEANVALGEALLEAINFRKGWFEGSKTNAYRLVNGEGDRLPGLIVDQYNDCIVVQISTLGMEKLKPFIIERLKNILNPRAIIEKSNQPSRQEEGLASFQGVLWGEEIDEVEICENGIRYLVSPLSGQKTGFFLDHREMRKLIGTLSKGKKVLNAFSYSGGFTLAALKAGAKRVDSVDISKQAVELAEKNVQLNGFDKAAHGFFAADVFEFLRERDLDYDVVILDPPAFAKRKKDVIQACRGYKDINRMALKKMPKGSLLLTCSCSYFVDELLFQKVIFQASVEAGRNVRIIGRHSLAPDHPINICHPEGDYLKSFLLYVQ